MLGSLDFLGAFKWPSLLAITLLPAASYVLDWRDHYRPQTAMLYGPATVGPAAALLTHDADARPLADAETRWCVRLSEADAVAGVELSYGGATAPKAGWTPTDPAERCATLARGARRHVWLRVRDRDGRLAARGWRLDGAPGRG